MNNSNNQTFSTTVFVHKFPYKSGETRMQLHQRQKQYAKRLLDFATQKVWGKSLKDVCFETLPDGKPVCRCGYISLSHSANCVAVALSDKPVGVDVQICTNVQNVENCGKVFSRKTNCVSCNQGENFFAIWCRKEALWKSMVNQPTSFLQVGYFLPTIYRNAGRKLLFCRYRQKCRVCNGGGFATYCLRTVSKILCGKPPLRRKAFKHFVNDSALLQTELIHMCVRLLHIRVQIFVTRSVFCFFSNFIEKQKKYCIGKEKNTPTNKNQCDFLLHESV